jgi:hypothetical protein
MDAHARVNARVLFAGAGMPTLPCHRSTGLTLTHTMFSAKVDCSTVWLRISTAVTTGFGAALS